MRSEYYKLDYDQISLLIEKEPDNALHYSHRGFVSIRKNDYLRAEEDFIKAFELCPSEAHRYELFRIVWRNQEDKSIEQQMQPYVEMLAKLQRQRQRWRSTDICDFMEFQTACESSKEFSIEKAGRLLGFKSAVQYAELIAVTAFCEEYEMLSAFFSDMQFSYDGCSVVDLLNTRVRPQFAFQQPSPLGFICDPKVLEKMEDPCKMLRILSGYGADPNMMSGFGFTPLINAADYKCPPEVVHTLLEIGADPNTVSSEDRNELTSLLYCLRPQPVAGAKSPKEGAWEPFGESNIKKAHLLLAYGADPNIGMGLEHNVMPLMQAVKFGFHPDKEINPSTVELIRSLLEHEANPDCADDKGVTPLSLASDRNLSVIVELLLLYGARNIETGDKAKEDSIAEMAEIIAMLRTNHTDALLGPAASGRQLADCNGVLIKAGFGKMSGDYAQFIKICNGYAFDSVELYGTMALSAPQTSSALLDIYTASEDFNGYYGEQLGNVHLCIGRQNGDYFTYNPGSGKYQIRSHECINDIWNEYDAFEDLFMSEVCRFSNIKLHEPETPAEAIERLTKEMKEMEEKFYDESDIEMMELYFMRGKIYYELEKWDEAMADFHKAYLGVHIELSKLSRVWMRKTAKKKQEGQTIEELIAPYIEKVEQLREVKKGTEEGLMLQSFAYNTGSVYERTEFAMVLALLEEYELLEFYSKNAHDMHSLNWLVRAEFVYWEPTPIYFIASKRAWSKMKDPARMLRLLKDRYFADPNEAAGDGSTPLGNATCNDVEIEILKTLLEIGANPNISFVDDGLQWLPLISCLRPVGIDGTEDDEDAWVPFDNRAIRKAELLLEYGADPNLSNPDPYNISPLIMAIQYGFRSDSEVNPRAVELVRSLLRYGANPNVTNSDGETAKELADKKGLSEIAELLSLSESFNKQQLKAKPQTTFNYVLTHVSIPRQVFNSLDMFYTNVLPVPNNLQQFLLHTVNDTAEFVKDRPEFKQAYPIENFEMAIYGDTFEQSVICVRIPNWKEDCDCLEIAFPVLRENAGYYTKELVENEFTDKRFCILGRWVDNNGELTHLNYGEISTDPDNNNFANMVIEIAYGAEKKQKNENVSMNPHIFNSAKLSGAGNDDDDPENAGERLRNMLQYDPEMSERTAGFYREMAEGGNAKAMYELAMLYRAGIGVPEDHNKAMEWVKKAAANGSEKAIEFLADAYGEDEDDDGRYDAYI